MRELSIFSVVKVQIWNNAILSLFFIILSSGWDTLVFSYFVKLIMLHDIYFYWEQNLAFFLFVLLHEIKGGKLK